MGRIFLLSLIFSHSIFAQIHAKNQKYIEISTGALDGISMGKLDNAGRWISLSFSKYHTKGHYVSIVAHYNEKFYETSNQIQLINQDFWVNGLVGLCIPFTSKKRVFINIDGGPLIGYELINKGQYWIRDNLQITNSSTINIGGIVGSNIEFIIGIKYSLLLNSSLSWVPNSSIQSFHFNNGFGFRYNFF
jgi:Conjugative transposon protein TraO